MSSIIVAFEKNRESISLNKSWIVILLFNELMKTSIHVTIGVYVVLHCVVVVPFFSRKSIMLRKVVSWLCTFLSIQSQTEWVIAQQKHDSSDHKDRIVASSDLSLNKFCNYNNLAYSTVRDWINRYVIYICYDSLKCWISWNN